MKKYLKIEGLVEFEEMAEYYEEQVIDSIIAALEDHHGEAVLTFEWLSEEEVDS